MNRRDLYEKDLALPDIKNFLFLLQSEGKLQVFIKIVYTDYKQFYLLNHGLTDIACHLKA